MFGPFNADVPTDGQVKLAEVRTGGKMLIFNSIIYALYQVCTEDSVCAENDTIIDCDKTPAPFKRKIIECYPQGTKNTSNYTSNDC